MIIGGLDAERDLLVPAPAHWPTVDISVATCETQDTTVLLTDSVARYPDVLGGHATIDRARGTAGFASPRRLLSDEIVHPRLGMLGAVYAHWLRRSAFHAGAFVQQGRAWAVVGARADGKSTLLGALALSGLTVLGDDTLVLEGTNCLAGVRCVDLRPDVATRLGCSDAVVVVRRGARHRLALGAAPTETPLAGWLFLAWGDELSLRALPTAERLRRVAGLRGWHRRGVSDGSVLVELAALPAWEVRRPRDWSQLAPIVERLHALTRAAAQR